MSTPFTSCWVSAVRISSMRSTGAPSPQSTSMMSTRRPCRWARSIHRWLNWPYRGARTRSPGDNVLTRAASQPPVPVAGKMNAWPVVVLKRFFKSRSSPAVSAGKAEDRWSSMARSIARRIRSGTFVGPGTNRKLRPAMAVVLEERGSGRCASGGLAPRLSRQSYFDLPAPQLYERVGVACLPGGGAWAAVAAAAVLQRLPEVGEQHAAPANGAGDVEIGRAHV